jgi:hypothetical protein
MSLKYKYNIILINLSLSLTTPSMLLFLNVDNSWKLLYTIQKNVSLFDSSLILPVLWIWPICFNNASNFVHLTVQSACCYVAWEFPVQKIIVIKIIFDYFTLSPLRKAKLQEDRGECFPHLSHQEKGRTDYMVWENILKNLPSMCTEYPFHPK